MHPELIRSDDILGFQVLVQQKYLQVVAMLFRATEGNGTLLPQTQPHFLSHEPICRFLSFPGTCHANWTLNLITNFELLKEMRSQIHGLNVVLTL
jgi:hypothetical protein